MLDVIDLNLEFHDHLVPETVVHHFNLHMEEGDIAVSYTHLTLPTKA